MSRLRQYKPALQRLYTRFVAATSNQKAGVRVPTGRFGCPCSSAPRPRMKTLRLQGLHALTRELRLVPALVTRSQVAQAHRACMQPEQRTGALSKTGLSVHEFVQCVARLGLLASTRYDVLEHEEVRDQQPVLCACS